MWHNPTGCESFGNDSLDLWLICLQVIVVCLSFYFYIIFGYCRFPDDDYDRYWFPVQKSNTTLVQSTDSGLQNLTSNHSILPMSVNGFDYPPDAVLRTALTDTAGNMTINLTADTNSYQAYLSLYYAELDPTANATSRNYYVLVPEFVPFLLNPILNETNGLFPDAFSFYFPYYGNGLDIFLYRDPTSPLGPLVNALEFFKLGDQMVTLTNLQDGELIIWL
jgi:hypothetical protein